MNHKLNLYRFVEQLIEDHAVRVHEVLCLPLYKLIDDDQCELARLYLESIDRDAMDCIYGKDFTLDNDYTCAVLSLLSNDSVENRDKLAALTKRNVVQYLEKTLQKLLDETCDEVNTNTHLDLGLHIRTHKDNGETYWSRY